MGDHWAWAFLAGVLTGLLIAAGYAAWVTRHVHGIVTEARKTISEMRELITKGMSLAQHVAYEYRPLKDRVDKVERQLERILRVSRGNTGGSDTSREDD